MGVLNNDPERLTPGFFYKANKNVTIMQYKDFEIRPIRRIKDGRIFSIGESIYEKAVLLGQITGFRIEKTGEVMIVTNGRKPDVSLERIL